MSTKSQLMDDFERAKRPSELSADPLEEAIPRREHDLERFDSISRRIGVLLAHNNYDQARMTLESEIEALIAERRQPELLDVSLLDLGCSPTVVGRLKERLNVVTFRDLLAIPMEEALAIHSVSEAAMLDVMKKVLVHSIRFALQVSSK